MRVGTYHFTCRIEDEALLPVFKGSTLRGGLGHSLRWTVCALKRQECRECLLAPSCGYSFIFANGSGPSRRPHPYLLVAPEAPERHLGPGDELDFSLVLFGRANDFLPHLVYAVKELGQAGLGKKSRAPGRFSLQRISLGDTPIWQDEVLQPSVEPPELLLASPQSEQAEQAGQAGQAEHAEPIRRINLHCLTPLRVKQDNKFQ